MAWLDKGVMIEVIYLHVGWFYCDDTLFPCRICWHLCISQENNSSLLLELLPALRDVSYEGGILWGLRLSVLARRLRSLLLLLRRV